MTRAELIAAALAEAWKTGPIADLPQDLAIAEEEAAYEAQEAFIAGRPISGWKVMPKAPFTGAPLEVSRQIANGATLPADMPAPEVEVELGVIFAQDLPPRAQAYDEAEVIAAFGGLTVVFEIVQSRFIDRKAAPMLHVVADALANGAFGYGTGFGAVAQDWIGLDLSALQASLHCNGTLVSNTERGFSNEGLLGQALWLANHASRRGIGLKAGDILLTGARIGPLVMRERGRYDLRIEGIGTAHFTY